MAKIDLVKVVAWSFLLLLFLISASHTFTYSYQDKIRIRVYLRFFMFLVAVLFIYIALQSACFIDFCPPLLVGLSILIAHTCALTKGRAWNFMFTFMLVCFILLYGFNLWTLL
jgi:hypothetical protein